MQSNMIRLLSVIDDLIKNEMDPKALARKIFDTLKSEIEFDFASLIFVSGETYELVAHKGLNDVRGTNKDEYLPLEQESPIFEIIQNSKTLYIKNIQDEPSFTKYIFPKNIKSWIGIPLRFGGIIIAVLILGSEQVAYFTQDDIEHLEILSAQVSIALGNLQLMKKIRQQELSLDVLTQTTRELNTLESNDDIQMLLETIVGAATELLNCKGGMLYLKVPGKEQLELKTVKGVEYSILKPGLKINMFEGMAGQVIRNKTPFFATDYANWSKKLDSLSNLFSSIIEVPLLIRNEAIGVLAVFDDIKGRRFIQADIQVLERFASQAALAIRNANLLENRVQTTNLTKTTSINDLSSYQSVFISYGGPDQKFAELLESELSKIGAKTFIFSKHATPGQRLHRVMRMGVNSFDRVVLICSKKSLNRPGVLNEIEETLQREAREGGSSILIPITLDNYVFSNWAPTRPDIAQAIRDRVVSDFRGTSENKKKFNSSTKKLIDALRRADRDV